MKKFEMPEIEVVNVSETANGFFDTWFETWFIHNDSDAHHCELPEHDDNSKPVTPNDDPANSNS